MFHICYPVKNGVSAETRNLGVSHIKSSLLFAHTDGYEEPQNKSYFNRPEAVLVLQLVHDLVSYGILGKNIGVICLYSAQKDLLNHMMTKQNIFIKVRGKPERDFSKVFFNFSELENVFLYIRWKWTQLMDSRDERRTASFCQLSGTDAFCWRRIQIPPCIVGYR